MSRSVPTIGGGRRDEKRDFGPREYERGCYTTVDAVTCISLMISCLIQPLNPVDEVQSGMPETRRLVRAGWSPEGGLPLFESVRELTGSEGMSF